MINKLKKYLTKRKIKRLNLDKKDFLLKIVDMLPQDWKIEFKTNFPVCTTFSSSGVKNE